MDMGVIEGIIILNLFMFILTLASPEYMYLNFSLIPAKILDHPWMPITSMFIHAGFDHIFFNMWALFLLGSYLERILGEWKFLKVYFIGGLFSSFFSIFAAYIGLISKNVSIVGASGAVFAVAACLAILRPNIQIVVFPIPFPMPLFYAVFGYMLIMSFLPGISWTGHLGGLIAGALFGLYYKRRKPEIYAYRGRYGYRFYY